MKMVRLIAVTVLAFGWALSGSGQSTSELLEQAIYAEEAQGDLVEAMRLYDQVIARGVGDDVYVAQALYRKSMCQLKAGQSDEAQETLETLLGDFSSQEQVITRAREAMAGMRVRDPAQLMPPGTLAYIELGSPGRQIELLLQMLEGTPLADPLARVGMGGAPHAGAHQEAAPGMIVRQLLNPSMMQEFKKIQGLAVGATQIRGEDSPLLGVLYPGESDALKGILRGLIGSVMSPAGELSGLSLFRMNDQVAAAYDDHVILVSNDLALLQFAARQYQRTHPEPSLADAQTFFIEMPKQARQDQLLTVWANGDSIYRGVTEMMGDDLPMALVGLNALASPGDIDELIGVARMESSSIRVDLEARLAEGHHCLVYDLIRTPAWSGADLQIVPDEAAALVSLRLGSFGQLSVAQALQRPLQRMTGLDIGRDLFTNIEQLTVFLAPSERSQPSPLPPVAQSVGVAVSSADPAFTRSLLHRSLNTLNHILSKGNEEITDHMPDQDLVSYKVIQVNDNPLSIHVGRHGNHTVLSLNPALALLTPSPGASASLRTAVNALPPTTGKALMVNLGGLVQLQRMAMPDAMGGPTADVVAGLATLLEKTHLTLRTEEEDNRLAIRLALSPIPNLGELASQVMQVQARQAIFRSHDAQPQVRLDHASGTVELSWTPRPGVQSSQVKLGKDGEEMMPARRVSRDTAEAVDLEPDTVYHWQVIEQLDDGQLMPGPTWTFATAGLMAHYPFDETDENRVADVSRHGRHGEAQGGARIVESYRGRTGVLSCDASWAYVDIPQSISDDFTIALWVNTTHPGVVADRWWEGTGLVDGEVLGPLHDFGTSVLDGHFAFGTAEPAPDFEDDTTVVSQTRIDDGAWHHLAAVRDAATGSMSIYVDGRLEGNVTGSSGPKLAPQRLRIGAIRSGADHGFFQGHIDDVRLYSYPLDPDAVANLVDETREATD